MAPSVPRRRRSVCPIACTLDLVGDRWTLLLVRDLLCGKTHFKEFAASPEGIATNILSNRLDRLLEHDLVEQRPSTEHSGRFAYHLTARGRSLGPVIKAIMKWGLEEIDGTEARMAPKR